MAKDFISVSKDSLKVVIISMSGWMVFTEFTRMFGLENIHSPWLGILGLVIGFLVVKFGWKK